MAQKSNNGGSATTRRTTAKKTSAPKVRKPGSASPESVLKAAKKTAKGSFGKPKAGVYRKGGTKFTGANMTKEDIRLAAKAEAEARAGKVRVGNQVFDTGGKKTQAEHDAAAKARIAADRAAAYKQVDEAAIKNIEETQGKAAAAKYRAFLDEKYAKAAGVDYVAPPAPAKKTAAKKATAPKPAAKKTAASNAPAETKPVAKKTAAKKTVAKKTTPAAKKSVPSKGTTRDFTAEVKNIEAEMSTNSKAARAGTMTKAEAVAANKALAAKKNQIQIDAKAAGAKVENPATRPARTPKAKPAEPRPAVKKPAAKTKPTARSTSSVKAIDDKMAKVNADYESGAITKAQRNARIKSLTAQRAKAFNGEGASSNLPVRRGNEIVKRGGDVVKRPAGEVAKPASKDVVLRAENAIAKAAEKAKIPPAAAKGIVKKVLGKAFWAYTVYDISRTIADYASKKAAPGTMPAGPNGGGLTYTTKAGTARDPLGLKGGSSAGKSIAKASKGPNANDLSAMRYNAMAKTYKSTKPSVSPAPSTGGKSGGTTGGTTGGGTASGKYGYLRNDGVYVIAHGDTIWDLAQKYKTTVNAIYKMNPELVRRKEAGKVSIFQGSKVKIPTKFKG